jgi:hypothetical protein
MDLAADGGSGTFTWIYAAESVGHVAATGRCEGVSEVGGQTRGSLATASAPHRVLEPAIDLGLYPVVNMPFSINRGQTGVVPLTLTLSNDGGQDHAEIALRELVITLDDGDGNPIVPADLLAGVTVAEGVNVYADIDAPETSGQTLTLPLSPEVVVTASEPVTLGLRLDILEHPSVDRFRVSLESASDLDVIDHVSGAPRSAVLTGASFPVRSAAGSIVSEATGLTATAIPLPDGSAGAGQDDVELLRLQFTAQGDESGSEVVVGGFAASIVDTSGVRIADVAERIDRLQVEGPLAIHADIWLTDAPDSVIVFEFSPPITVPVGSSGVTVTVRGRVGDDPVYGPLRLRLESPDSFDARDGNVSSIVGVTYSPAEVQGPLVTLQQPAPGLQATWSGHLPPFLPQGAGDVPALSIVLEHPGPPNSASVVIDTLQFTCLDADREPLDADAVLDGYTVLWNGAAVTTPLVYDGERMVVPSAGLVLDPGTVGTLDVAVAIEANAPPVGLEVVATADHVVARDQNLSTRVTVTAADGLAWPASSGLARIQPAADEMRIGWTDRLPPLLPGDGSLTEAAVVVVHNPAPPGTAPAALHGLTLHTADRDHAMVPTGDALQSGLALVDGNEWAAAAVVSTDSTLQFLGVEPLILLPGATVEVVIQIAPRPDTSAPSLRLGLLSDGVDCRQTDATTSVAVRPDDGLVLPFWTEASGLSAADLASSYINFPNPFAAGRASTSFAFQLARSGRVSLRILTARGESVATLLADRPLTAGLHQDVTWDGRNGRDTVVRNGVYIAELRVSYDDGGSERLLRKVAVVR